MTPAEYQRISGIVGRALELRGEERQRYLGSACDHDPELRREVSSLLRQAAQPWPLLDEPLVRPREPERIGPYRLLERIADGGMGTVYRVERQDDFELEAALKLVRIDRRTRAFLTRFHNERQLLARLDHPAIARILDGGTTPQGAPYFVMELVVGQPIDVWCDDHRLSIRQRLELFLEVCAAVSFAHRNLIVHRDLKPGHILVSCDGQPKLIDFGIAQPLPEADDGADDDIDPSWMTLKYASPEQVRGQTLTTASDVYSLAMVLYRLLTGTAPYAIGSGSLAEVRRQILQAEPRPPSNALAALGSAAAPLCRDRGSHLARLRRTLRGDLDSILLRALDKRPEGRYASVDQLADDLRRYLDHRPVVARRGAWPYHTGKLLRRHAVATILIAVLLAATATITLLWHQATMQRDHAEWFGSILGSVFVATDPNARRGQVPAELRILDRAHTQIAAADANESPAYRAGLLQEMGRAYLRLGAYDKARQPLQEALALRRASERSDHPFIAESLHDLAHALDKLGDPAARHLILEAVSIQRRNAEQYPLELARGLTSLGRQHYDDGFYEEGEAALLEALDRKRRLADISDEDLVVTLSNLAATWRKLGKDRQAVDTYREVLAIRRRSLGSLHTDVARSLSSLATTLRDLGQFDEATELLEEAVTIRQKLLGQNHPDTARVRRTLGTVWHARGDLEAAASSYGEALRVQQIVLPDHHPEIAVTRTKQAALHADLGQSARCQILAGQAIATLELAEHPNSGRLAAARKALATCAAAGDAS